MLKRLIKAVVAASLLLLCSGVALFWVTRDSRPNVLILVWDTVRADHLSLYGYQRPTSPNLDRFAEQAVVFDQAVAPSMWTVPSHGSLFTGQPPSAHGANTWWWRDGSVLTLAEWFAGQGYRTWAFSSNPNLVESDERLLQGFETVLHSFRGGPRTPSRRATERKLIERDKSTRISPAFVGEKSGAWAYNAGPVARKHLRRFVRKQRFRREPWLAFVNLMEAHAPRVPSLASRERVVGDPELIERGFETVLTSAHEFGFIVGATTYTEAELEAIEAVYDAAIGDLDAVTGEILSDLDELGVLDDTIVVIVSDHGEALGEHGLLSHRYGLYEEIVWIPLVISWRGKLHPRRVKEPVSPTALFWTLLELTGTAAPALEHPMDRTSLLASPAQTVHAQLIEADAPGFGAVLSQRPEVDVSPYLVPIRVARQGDLKLFRYEDGRRALFDLHADPQELTPLLGGHPELEAASQGYEGRFPRADAQPMPAKFEDEQRELLKALGYVQ